jgi:nucleoside-diphosphate-sugar epimerase
MRVLVTGASGFVGRTVCESALRRGLKVRGSYRSQGSQSLMPAEVEKIRIPSVNGDTDWSTALTGVDGVIHLAACVHIANDTTKDSLATYRAVNTVGTKRLVNMAIAAGVRRFIYMSTIKVNGEETLSAPFTEGDSPQPDGAYAISKWEAEQVLHEIAAKSDIEVVILRPPLVYGMGVGANFIRLLHFVQRRIPLPLGSVSNRRSFVYVKNLADAALVSLTHHQATGRTYLVSDGEDVSTPDLLRRIAIAMGVSARVFHCPPRLLETVGSILGNSSEVSRLLGSLSIDSTRFRFETGWLPPYTMSQGLRETAQWYLANKTPTGAVS